MCRPLFNIHITSTLGQNLSTEVSLLHREPTCSIKNHCAPPGLLLALLLWEPTSSIKSHCAPPGFLPTLLHREPTYFIDSHAFHLVSYWHFESHGAPPGLLLELLHQESSYSVWMLIQILSIVLLTGWKMLHHVVIAVITVVLNF